MRRSALPTALTLLALGCGGEPAARSRWRTAATRTPEARLEATAARVGRRVLYVGGITGDARDMASAQPSRRVDVYDPDAGSWTRGPDLPEAAPKHHITLAVIGERVFIVAGFDGIIGRFDGEEFRPSSATFVLEGSAWRRLAEAPLARGGATAQVIDGRVYVTGGTRTEGVDAYRDTFVYDPATDVWARRASLRTAREHLASCRIASKMLVVGGWAGRLRAASNVAELYDPATDTWTARAPLLVARGGLGAAVAGGACFVVGGEDWALPFPGTFSTLEAYDVARDVWRLLPAMPTARHGAGVVDLDGRLVVMGGGPGQGNTYTDVVEEFLP